MLYARVDPQTREILEYPIHEHVLKDRFKSMNISLPNNPRTADLKSWGYYSVPTNEYPIAPEGYRAVLGPPVWNQDNLERVWQIVPVDADFEARLWQVIRNKRNQLLQASDWTEMPSVSEIRSVEWNRAWISYRQQLRDITKLAYPTHVVWPRKPNETE